MKTDFVQAGAVRLQYFEASSGPDDIVLVHGYRSSGRVWALVQECLDGARFRSIAISHRGAGDSDRTASPDDYTVEGFAADDWAALTALGLSRFVLVGHSMGGATVTRFALDHPEMLRGLVLLDPAPLLGRGLTEGWEAQVRSQWEARTAEPGTRDGVPPAYFEALQADVARNPLERLLGGRKSMATLRLRERLAELTVPTLVIGGDRDTTVGIDNIVTEFLALRPEVRSLHVFHGVGHSPNSECHGELTSVLERFVDGLD